MKFFTIVLHLLQYMKEETRRVTCVQGATGVFDGVVMDNIEIYKINPNDQKYLKFDTAWSYTASYNMMKRVPVWSLKGS